MVTLLCISIGFQTETTLIPICLPAKTSILLEKWIGAFFNKFSVEEAKMKLGKLQFLHVTYFFMKHDFLFRESLQNDQIAPMEQLDVVIHITVKLF